MALRPVRYYTSQAYFDYYCILIVASALRRTEGDTKGNRVAMWVAGYTNDISRETHAGVLVRSGLLVHAAWASHGLVLDQSWTRVDTHDLGRASSPLLAESREQTGD